MRTSLLGVAALSAGAVGGAVLGYLAERTVIDPAPEHATEAGPGPASASSPAVERSTLNAPDGTALAVRASGPAGAPRIVLVHGMSLGQEIFDAQRDALRRSFRVVTVDLRGHGDSADAASGDYSAAAIGSDVATVLAAFRGAPCVLVGHSMGGMAVLAALNNQPELLGGQVAGVVLMNTAASAVLSGLGGGSVLAGLAFLRERVRSSLGRLVSGGLDAEGRPRGNDLATVVTRMLGVGSDAPPSAVETVRRLVLGSRPQVAGELWRTAGTVDLLDAARRVTVPALVIAGERDRLLPSHHSRRLAEVLPDAELIELPAVGHVAMLERAGQVTDALDVFARRVFGSAARTA